MSHSTAAQDLDLLGQLMITDSFAVVIINCVIFVELTRPRSRSQYAPPTCGTVPTLQNDEDFLIFLRVSFTR